MDGMKNTVDKLGDVIPSATPSEDDIRKWEILPRDEQLRRLRTALTQPDCSTVAQESMSEVLAAARARVEAKRG